MSLFYGDFIGGDGGERYMAFNSRTRISAPNFAARTNATVTTRLMVNTPTWAPKRPRLYFPNWCTRNDGVAPTEIAPSENLVINGATLEYTTNTFKTITFNGSTSVTIPPGTGVWSDPVAVDLAANSTCFVRTNASLPALTFGPFDCAGGSGEGAIYNASVDLTKLTTTSFTTSSTSNVYGPTMCVARGWDGVTPVVGGYGNSIGWGANSNQRIGDSTSRGNFGYLAYGFDDAASSTRYAFVNLCTPGASPSNDVAGFTYRRAMISSLPNVPFTRILSEHGTNANGTFATMESEMIAWWTYVKNWLHIPIIQTTIMNRTSVSDNTGWSNYSGQSQSKAANLTFNTNILGSSYAAYLAGVINVNTYITDGGNPDLWLVPSLNTTLAAGASSGATSVSLNAAPSLYDCLVIEPGASGTIDTDGTNGLVVTAVSGSGPYTVTLNNSLSRTHSSGAAVKAALTKDGVHPYISGHLLIKGSIIDAKNSGMFR